MRVIAAGEFQRLGSLTRLLQIEFDDLFQTGVVGLITAVDRFDPRLSGPKTYFARRIRGAILDFLRSFPYFKNGEAVERVEEDELLLHPTQSVELKEAEIRVDLERLAASLTARQRTVIMGIACEIPQYIVARTLGVNQSRVSQIKNEGLATLRSVYAVQLTNQPSA